MEEANLKTWDCKNWYDSVLEALFKKGFSYN